MILLKHLREMFPWFPSIDYDACRKDLQCLNFCPHDVFEWDAKTGRPVVAHPSRCFAGCEICLEGCVTGAISLPSKHDVQAAFERFRDARQQPQKLGPQP